MAIDRLTPIIVVQALIPGDRGKQVSEFKARSVQNNFQEEKSFVPGMVTHTINSSIQETDFMISLQSKFQDS